MPTVIFVRDWSHPFFNQTRKDEEQSLRVGVHAVDYESTGPIVQLTMPLPNTDPPSVHTWNLSPEEARTIGQWLVNYAKLYQ